jgi:hypothetical protein
MNKRDLNRRHFLQAVGATALTYPFLRGLPSFAAAGGAAPTYLVLLFTPCGVVRHKWGATNASGATVPDPTSAGGPSLTTPFTFRDTLAPLAPVQKSVILLDGLKVSAANGSHEAGMAALWTGLATSGDPATGPSVDQVIAAQLNAGRPFPSIELMVRSAADFTDREVKTRMIYNAAGAYLDPHDNPVEARSTFFATTPTTGTAGPDKTTFIRQKLFGQLNTELTALQPRLCTDDRQQLQALQDSWNALDSQLSAAATASQGCSAPAAAPSGYVAPSIDFPTTAQLQMDILALALACDLTRVASLQFSTATSQVTHSWLGATQTDTHHDYSHNGPTSLYSLGADIYNQANASLYTNLAQQLAIDNWYAKQVAYLAQKLASLTGANGTLLDQTVICWGSELDMGAAHNHDDTPFVLVGGGNGKLKTNQMVRFPLKLDGDPTTGSVVDRSHNDLLITLAKVMGLNLSTVGSAQYCTGPITQILT